MHTHVSQTTFDTWPWDAIKTIFNFMHNNFLGFFDVHLFTGTFHLFATKEGEIFVLCLQESSSEVGIKFNSEEKKFNKRWRRLLWDSTTVSRYQQTHNKAWNLWM